jgi:lysylphosphatidylglycerol synthetase-like protein (DUF2156 family)
MPKNSDKSTNSPKVTIFGEVFSENNHRGDSGSTGGFFLIFIGVLLFLNTLEILPWTIWENLLTLWPILIILFGLNILLGKNLITRTLLNLINLVLFGSLLLFILKNFAPQLVTWLPEELTNYIQLWRLTKL